MISLSILLQSEINYNPLMKIILMIAVGGALGAVARYGVLIGLGNLIGFGFPYGTMAINICGSFLLGALVEIMALIWSPSEELRLFFVVGVLGAFTTFSSFSLDTITLIQRSELLLAVFYVAGSVLLSIAGFLAGLVLFRSLLT